MPLIRRFGVQLPHTNAQSVQKLKLFYSRLDTDGLYLQVCSLSLTSYLCVALCTPAWPARLCFTAILQECTEINIIDDVNEKVY